MPDAMLRVMRRRESLIARKLRRGHQSGQVVELTLAEARVLFDRTARKQLNMSGAEFLRRLDAGDDLPDSPVTEHLALLAGGARTGL
jgi:hypothetical protein